MPFLSHFIHTNKEGAPSGVKELLENSTHTKDYYVLLIGAVLLAIGGIFADSIPIVIASMIVAPLAYPILALGFGITVRDWRLVGRVFLLFIASCLLALGLAIGITLFFGNIRAEDTFITFTTNRHLAIAVAVVAGGIAAYGTVRPKVATAITGVAIAVSLMPPLVATGIGIAASNSSLAMDAFVLFLLNVIGIIVASIVVFALFNIRREHVS